MVEPTSKPRQLIVCPLIQQAPYRLAKGLRIAAKTYSDAALKQIVLEKLMSRGAIYVTGQYFSRENRTQQLAMNLNSGLGKTEYVRNQLMPFLAEFFNGIAYLNVEGCLHIREIMAEECSRREIEGYFDDVVSGISQAADHSESIVIDEIHWVFPSADPNPQNKIIRFSDVFFRKQRIFPIAEPDPRVRVFRFNAAFSGKQSEALDLINNLMKKGKKIIFITWLHPQDLSLTGSSSRPEDNYYQGTESMLRMFTFPIVEMPHIQEVDG